MLNLIITGLFLISAAIASGSIIIVSQLRTKYRLDSLLYMQVFYFMFGFYALWGQVIIVSYLAPLINKPALDKIHEVSVLLGTPFIVFGWSMFLKFINDFTGFKTWKAFNAVFLILNLAFLIIIGIWNSKSEDIESLDILKYYFIFSNFIYSTYVVIVILSNRGKQQLLKLNKGKNLAVGILLFMLTQNTSLVIYYSELWLVLVFIFLFFSGTAFVPVFLRYNLKIEEQKPVSVTLVYSFEGFCAKYEISPREKDIIREICNGLSNQQIADKLFISLQTVKDHTHRIYGKTMATSRMQLMKMVQEVSGN